jgi:hypothetical protein
MKIYDFHCHKQNGPSHDSRLELKTTSHTDLVTGGQKNHYDAMLLKGSAFLLAQEVSRICLKDRQDLRLAAEPFIVNEVFQRIPAFPTQQQLCRIPKSDCQ